MATGDLWKSIIFSVGFLLVLCTAQDDYVDPIQNNLLYNKQDIEYRGNLLQCYDCNSFYDPRCGDPFNPYSIGIINCTERNTPEHLVDPLDPDRKLQPTLCRKIVQKVNNKIRVIRGCGYIKDSHDDKQCYRRTGTIDVEVVHCSCTKSLCNAGNIADHSSWIIFILILSVVFNPIFNRLSV